MIRPPSDYTPCRPVRIDADTVQLTWFLVHRAMGSQRDHDRESYERARAAFPGAGLPEWDAVRVVLPQLSGAIRDGEVTVLGGPADIVPLDAA